MNKIEVGEPALNFSTKDYLGNNINFMDYAGKKILLSFYRDASCPFCNLRINELTKHRAEIENKGIKVLCFFNADAKSIQQFASINESCPFTIIPDPQLKIFELYAIKKITYRHVKSNGEN